MDRIHITDIAIVGTMIIILIPLMVSAGVVHGFANLEYGAWDFSDSTLVDHYVGDMVYMEVYDPDLGFIIIISSFNGSCFTAVLDSTLEELTCAPEDLSNYDDGIGPCMAFPSPCYYTYVIHTADGFYAKFRLISPTENCLSPYCIEYVYQPDGSRRLVDATGVERSSWGRVKVLLK